MTSSTTTPSFSTTSTTTATAALPSSVYTNFIQSQLKEYFSTTKITYNEENKYFHISPYDNIPKKFFNNNSNRIFKLPKIPANINKYNFDKRNFFDVIDFCELEDKGALTEIKTPSDNPFLNTYSHKSYINFASFKTVVWSMINKDTLVFVYLNSSYDDSHKIKPYSPENINVWSSNYNLISHFASCNGASNDHKRCIFKNLLNENKKILDETDEEEIFSSVGIPSFISFIQEKVDVCINYGEDETNSVSKKIFDKISEIDSVQNINIEEFFRNLHSYYDNHSLIKICKYMDFEETSTPQNKEIIDQSIETIKKLNENVRYGENFLKEYLSVDNIPNKEIFNKNLQNFVKQITSRVIIITKIWINYSKNIFDLAHLSNTNFDNIVQNKDEIVKGIISTNYNIFHSSLTSFTTLNTFNDNFLKKNIFFDDPSFTAITKGGGYNNANTTISHHPSNSTGNTINVVKFIPYILKMMENMLTSLSDFEKFFFNFFTENSFLTDFYWIFNRFLDLYNVIDFRKCISDNIYKKDIETIIHNYNCLGLYKGMIYFFDTEEFKNKVLNLFFPFDECQVVNTWNFILVLQNNDSWIGVKFIYDDVSGGANGDGGLQYNRMLSSSSSNPALREDIYGYFGTSIVCDHPYSFLKNLIEFYFSFFFSQKKFLNIDDHTLFKNISQNNENTKMIKPMNEFSKNLFVEDFSDVEVYDYNLCNVWYNSKNKYTTIYTDSDFKKYIDISKIYMKIYIISCIEEYEKNNKALLLSSKNKMMAAAAASSSSQEESNSHHNHHHHQPKNITTPNRFKMKNKKTD